MESGAELRDRVLEGGAISSSNGGAIREISSMDQSASPGGSTKPLERKKEPHAPRSSIVPTPQHRSSHSSSSGAIDLQAVVGRSGSSISGVTVPIRLDALSFLLNSAVIGNFRMPSQMPCYQPAYPMFPQPQMGCSPHGMCMGSQYCPSHFPNQFSAHQAGFVACGSQQNMQSFQQQVPNFNQGVGNASQIQNQGPFAGMNPQSGMSYVSTGTAFNPGGTAFNPAGTTFNAAGTPFNSTELASGSTRSNSVQNSFGSAPSESINWPKKPYEKAGSSERFGNNSFSSERQSGFRKFEDNWSSRQQSNSHGRGFSRDRGNVGGSSWQGSSREQDREPSFGDRSRNTGFGSKRNFRESPETFQDRDSFSKRSRWPSSQGGGRENSNSSQQINKQNNSPLWSNKDNTSDKSNMGQETNTVKASAGDEDWEIDYSEQTTGNIAKKPDVQLPVVSSPKNSCETVIDLCEVVKPAERSTEEFSAQPETEDGQSDSGSGKDKAKIDLKEQQQNPEDSASVPGIVDIEDQSDEEMYIVDGEDNNDVLVEVKESSPS
ncbi:uncharacterized protein [Pyxicephalus adspersus]|uniref:Uncharacterized protein n=1 Tax=Pyxicephalus adspersus TaxID=30357 RepID=A0AAV2ZP12_PYXAD|nr:TPA: hypothetical protein GDO54_003269 [Pyxicephalus adspersus]